MECPICYEPMNASTTLKCGHTFHKECIDRWAEHHCTCPYCRVVFYSRPNDDMGLMMAIVVAYAVLFFVMAFY